MVQHAKTVHLDFIQMEEIVNLAQLLSIHHLMVLVLVILVVLVLNRMVLNVFLVKQVQHLQMMDYVKLVLLTHILQLMVQLNVLVAVVVKKQQLPEITVHYVIWDTLQQKMVLASSVQMEHTHLIKELVLVFLVLQVQVLMIMPQRVFFVLRELFHLALELVKPVKMVNILLLMVLLNVSVVDAENKHSLTILDVRLVMQVSIQMEVNVKSVVITRTHQIRAPVAVLLVLQVIM